MSYNANEPADNLLVASVPEAIRTKAEQLRTEGIVTPRPPLYGTGTPTASLGENGDTYTDTSAGKVYFKENNAWTLKYNQQAIFPALSGGKVPAANMNFATKAELDAGTEAAKVLAPNVVKASNDEIKALITSLESDTSALKAKFNASGQAYNAAALGGQAPSYYRCSNGCSWTCSSGCSGGCANGCAGGCLAGCTGGCASCTGTCSGSCSTGCSTTCTGCSGACSGCGATCSGSCSNYCDGRS